MYFWGFTLCEKLSLPKTKDDLVIMYIGKSENNMPERIMQEITQLVLGGFGNIPTREWLKKKRFETRLKEEQSKKHRRKNMTYNPDGLHVLGDFRSNRRITANVDWMFNSLIFCWIPMKKEERDKIKKLEQEMHHIVRTNCLGTGSIKKDLPKKDISKKNETNNFHSINWSDNLPLKEWLKEVNQRII